MSLLELLSDLIETFEKEEATPISEIEYFETLTNAQRQYANDVMSRITLLTTQMNVSKSPYEFHFPDFIEQNREEIILQVSKILKINIPSCQYEFFDLKQRYIFTINLNNNNQLKKAEKKLPIQITLNNGTKIFIKKEYNMWNLAIKIIDLLQNNDDMYSQFEIVTKEYENNI